MDAGEKRMQPCARAWRAAIVLALLAGFGLAAPPAWAGRYDTVGADDDCIYKGNDSFRDLDGNGCSEPIVASGDLRLRFLAKGSRDRLRVTFKELSLSAPRTARVVASCTPSCGGHSNRVGGGRVKVDLKRPTFGRGALVGVRVWQDGYVGRFYGYRIGTRRPKYMACLLRSQNGQPKRCHS